jgi:hypothetical protein
MKLNKDIVIKASVVNQLLTDSEIVSLMDIVNNIKIKQSSINDIKKLKWKPIITANKIPNKFIDIKDEDGNIFNNCEWVTNENGATSGWYSSEILENGTSIKKIINNPDKWRERDI